LLDLDRALAGAEAGLGAAHLRMPRDRRCDTVRKALGVRRPRQQDACREDDRNADRRRPEPANRVRQAAAAPAQDESFPNHDFPSVKSPSLRHFTGWQLARHAALLNVTLPESSTVSEATLMFSTTASGVSGAALLAISTCPSS